MSRGRARRPEDRLVTVCDICWTAACWQGLLVCEDGRKAGTSNLTVRELRQLKLEHPSNWGENVI